MLLTAKCLLFENHCPDLWGLAHENVCTKSVLSVLLASPVTVTTLHPAFQRCVLLGDGRVCVISPGNVDVGVLSLCGHACVYVSLRLDAEEWGSWIL